MSPANPETSGTADIERYMRARRSDIDAALEQLLPTVSDAPALAIEAMRYSLFAGGKRLRPILAVAAADSVSRVPPAEKWMLVRPSACALEMIHTYSLVHDDLPAMDDDTLRRGRPTAHVVYGEGLAILAGDALLTEAFRILSRWPDTDDRAVLHRKLKVSERIAQAAGVGGMVGGQVIDLHASGQVAPLPPTLASRDLSFDRAALQAMHERKTAALIRAAAVAGAIMAGGTDAEVEAVDDFAAHLGLGFQIVDDILDVEGAAEELGKTVGKDAAAGKPTYPSMFGLEESRRMARSSITRAKTSLEAAGLGGRLSEIADWVVGRSH